MSYKDLKRVKISEIIESQIPEYFSESNPLFIDFLRGYYNSQEFQGGPLDLINNLDTYIKHENLNKETLISETTLTAGISAFTKTINVQSTAGWPQKYGLLKIDNEIITYTGITSTSFTGCIRGFCGVDSLNELDSPDTFVFVDTVASSHDSGDTVINLSNLFAQRFYEDLKYQYAPGLENVGINTQINPSNLFKYLKDFYKSKGTEKSFRILFDILFGVDITFTRPGDYLFTPSDSQWVVNNFIVVEDLTGDIRKIQKGVQLTQSAKVGFAGASGVVYYYTDIPKTEGRFYSKIGFDKATIRGNFANTATTQITESVKVGDTIISVDSTVGFDTSGTLALKNETNTDLEYFTYTSKTLTQFLGCVGLGTTVGLGRSISEKTNLYENNFVKGIIDGKDSIFAVTNVVSGIDESQTRYLSVNDKINIKTFGYENNDQPIFTSWIYNIRNSYSVTSKKIVSSTICQFTLENYKNIFVFDTLEIFNKKTNQKIATGTVKKVSSTFVEVEVQSTSTINSISNSNLLLVRNLNKVQSQIYSESKGFVSEVQNTYIDSDDFQDVFVSSSGLPSHEISSSDNSYIFDKSDVDISDGHIVIPNHNFYSGQLVFYEPVIENVNTSEPLDGLEKGKYYVKKIDSNTIALAFTRKNVDSSSLIKIGVKTLSATKHKISLDNLSKKGLSSQNFLKVFPRIPQPTPVKYEIDEGNTGVGLFRNGVEIIHSRSEHQINYGAITNINVINSIDTFEVTQPPKLLITDPAGIGSGAEGVVHLIGSISEVIVDDPGFRFLQPPRVEVIGGNGEDCILDVNLKQSDKEYSIEFDAAEKSIGINTTTDRIVFKVDHGFATGDRVKYDTNGNESPVILRYDSAGVGIATTLAESDIYYVDVVNRRSIKLHYNNNDSIAGINTVDFYSGGTGLHKLTLDEPITIISSIDVSDKGLNYQNRMIKVDAKRYPPENYVDIDTILTGINTASYYIFAKNHKFETGDLIEYSSTGTPIVGLATTSKYYVLKIDEDKFRLCGTGSSVITTVVSVGATGISTNVTTSFDKVLLDQEKYLRFSGIGTGVHTFKFPEIQVKVEGITAIGSTVIYHNVKCKGEIDHIFLYKGGSGYGSKEVFDFVRAPKVEVTTGFGAKLRPIISSTGEISQVIVSRKGQDYVSEPTIIVSGIGTGAQLKPIIKNGEISSVKIVDPGSGYEQDSTLISVVSVGKTTGVFLRADLQKWTVDNFELNKKLFTTSDDGAFLESLNQNYGNRYVNYGVSRELRFKLSDNINDDYKENPTGHSPILGWAYDGNPIYGPYGFTSPTDSSSVKKLNPGYSRITKSNRPTDYPLGFFVEDNVFLNSGDLDENNGRYCITPEFPNGTYAYFCTISDNNGSGAFTNNRFPIYPYVVGKHFNNRIRSFNLEYFYDESLFNSKDTTLIKNMSPYDVDSYQFLDLKSSPKKEILEVKSINKTTNVVDAVSIISPGKDYRVGDLLDFDDEGTDGGGASAVVFTVEGKKVNSIVGTQKIYTNTELTYNKSSIVGVTTIPHDLIDGDIIKILSVRSDDNDSSNDASDSVYFRDLLKNHEISVSISTCGLSTSIPSYSGASSSGFTTFIPLRESVATVNQLFKVNDIVGIKSEYMLVLNVDDINNRIRVLRGYNPSNPSVRASVGAAYTIGDIVEQKPTEFKINLVDTKSSRATMTTKIFYFDPENSVGLGTTGSVTTFQVGVGNSLNQKTRIVPEQSIYVPDHKLITGDKLIYSANAGIALSVSRFSNLSSPFSLPETVYAVNKGKDFIGLSTTRVGLGSTANTGLYFVSNGEGEDHQLTTDFGETLISDVLKEFITVGTAETHGLTNDDIVILNLESRSTKTYNVIYHPKNRKVSVGSTSTSSSGITTGITGSTFRLNNHEFVNGSKVIYSASSPASPLESGEEYYVIKVNENAIRLASSEYDSKFSYSFIELTSVGSGTHTFYPINPELRTLKGDTLRFNVSNSSMRYFDLKFYRDSQFQNTFVGTGTFFSSNAFETKYVGEPGKTGSYVELYTKYDIPTKLFYNFELTDVNASANSSKLLYEPDDEVPNGSSITLYESKFNIAGQVYDAENSQTEFKLDVVPSNIIEKSSYTSSDAEISYTTTSTSTTGPISVVKLISPGVGYLSPPSIENVITADGDGAQFFAVSKSIGAINKSEIYNPSFAIPSDYTVKPILDFPYTVKIKNNFSFRRVVVVEPGKNYASKPKIIAVDTETGNEISNLVFTANMSGKSVSSVTVNLNRSDLSKDIRIIPINNSNGYPIFEASYNDSTKKVTLTLFPSVPSSVMSLFTVGDKIFVEGIVSSSTTVEYNSKSNGYDLFEITAVDAINKTIEYDFKLGNPGTFSSRNSNGYVILQDDLAQFSAVYGRGSFRNDERITITKPSGSKKTFKVTSNNGWNGQILKLVDINIDGSSSFVIEPGDSVFGQISKQPGTVEYVRQSSATAQVNSFYTKPIGWEKENGKPSVKEQVIQDSDYYQRFSYDIKTTVSSTEWKETIDALNHPAGTKSFGSVIIISEP